MSFIVTLATNIPSCRPRLLTRQSSVASSGILRYRPVPRVRPPYWNGQGSPGTTASKNVAWSHRSSSQTAFIPINTSPTPSAVPTGWKHWPATSQQSGGFSTTKRNWAINRELRVRRDYILSNLCFVDYLVRCIIDWIR